MGIDLGTSYFKVGIFDGNGSLRGLGRRPVEKETGDGSICELPVSAFWKTLRACIGEAVGNAGIGPDEIETVSYSSQVNSFILLDENDEPLTPLILWPDRRASDMDLPLADRIGEDEFTSKTGLGIRPDSGFSVAKIKWFQEEHPELWKHVKTILSISDYLTFGLTGRKISDMSTSSMSGLFDPANEDMWDKALEIMKISRSLFPTVERLGNFVGTINKQGAELTRLSSGTLYYLGGLDHHCAAVGSGIIGSDDVCESTGTVLSCVGSSSVFNPGKNYCSSPGLFDGQFFRMAFDNNGALSLEWYRKNFAAEYSIGELLDMAARTDQSSMELSAKPCACNYPGLDGFMNIRPTDGHGHFVRALLESTSRSLAGLINTLKGEEFSGRVISTGGGAQSALWIKIKADMLGCDFLVPECSETACMGAAMIGAAGMAGSGSWDDLSGRWIRFKKED